MVTKEEVDKARAVYEAARETRYAVAAYADDAAYDTSAEAAAEAALEKYTKLRKEYEKCINS